MAKSAGGMKRAKTRAKQPGVTGLPALRRAAKKKESRMAANQPVRNRQRNDPQPNLPSPSSQAFDTAFEQEPASLEFSDVVTDIAKARTPRSDLAKAIASEARGAELIDSLKTQSRRSGVINIYAVNPYDLYLEPGWNARNFETDRRKSRIATLAASIAAIGVREPLMAHIADDKLIVHSGWNRLFATYHAIEHHNSEIRSIPVRLGASSENENDRLLSQIVNNMGDPLTPIEQSTVYKNLHDKGWTEEQIAAKSGTGAQWIRYCLDAQALPTAVQNLMRNGTISLTYTLRLYKDFGNDAERTARVIEAAQEKATSEGSTRILPKHARQARAETMRELTSRQKRRTRRKQHRADDSEQALQQILGMLSEAQWEADEEVGIAILRLPLTTLDTMRALGANPQPYEGETYNPEQETAEPVTNWIEDQPSNGNNDETEDEPDEPAEEPTRALDEGAEEEVTAADETDTETKPN